MKNIKKHYDHQSALPTNLLTINEVAKRLNCAPQTLRNWIAKRQFPFVKVGRKHMILERSLALWIASKEVQPWVS